MTRYGTWVSYSGSARLILAIVLLAAAGGLVCAAIRLRRPVRVPRPGLGLTVFMVLAWGLAGVAFLACLAAYVSREELREHIAKPPPADPITPVTVTAAVVLFLVVYIATPYGRWTRMSSAAIAAMAAAAIFELPFDLIIWTRVYPPAPDPALYRALFFAPLVLVELTTLSLLALSPMVKLSRTAFFCLALMLLVFALWALAGFGYPSAPVPFAMNVASKLLAFVTALSLFRPEWFTWWRQSRPDDGVGQASGTPDRQTAGLPFSSQAFRSLGRMVSRSSSTTTTRTGCRSSAWIRTATGSRSTGKRDPGLPARAGRGGAG